MFFLLAICQYDSGSRMIEMIRALQKLLDIAGCLVVHGSFLWPHQLFHDSKGHPKGEGG